MCKHTQQSCKSFFSLEGSAWVGQRAVGMQDHFTWEPGLTFEFQGQEVLSTGGWKLVAPFGGGARLQRGRAACLANARGRGGVGTQGNGEPALRLDLGNDGSALGVSKSFLLQRGLEKARREAGLG